MMDSFIRKPFIRGKSMIELLAPAGDLEKLKIAILYGADAVFIGGEEFSLRARASNFTLDDIKEGCAFAHQYGKKVYVTTNIIPHHEDMEGLLPYLKGLEDAGVDAIIAASPYIIDTALNQTNLEVHISTQQSAMNINTVNFWNKKGATRVVLARDLTLDEIKLITNNTKAEIEVFIHGGMCAGYSGRCSLSNHLTNRDANRGGCAHSCRWFYDLKKDGKKVEDVPFSMSSKDLSAIHEVEKLIDLGVNSLKIEGRMKSLHYVATVVRTYRMLIDEYLETGIVSNYDYYMDNLQKAENRETSTGFFHGVPELPQQLFEKRSEKVMQNFVGLVLSYDKDTKTAIIETRNVYRVGETLEVFSRFNKETYFVNTHMESLDGVLMDRAMRAKEPLRVKIPFEVHPYDMIRANR